MNKISLVGMLVGLAIVVSGWLRYFVIWYDPSAAFLFMAIGCLTILVAYGYHLLRAERKKIEHLDIVVDLLELWVKKKVEAKE